MLLCPSHLQQALDSTCHASPTLGLWPLLHWTHLLDLDPHSSQISSSHVLKHGTRTHSHKFPTGSGLKLTVPSPTVPAPALGLYPSHQRLRPARALVLSLLPPPPNPWSLNPGDPPVALTCLYFNSCTPFTVFLIVYVHVFSALNVYPTPYVLSRERA